MKSGASDPFGDNEDERSESSESATGERGPVSEDEQHESADESSGERRESEPDQTVDDGTESEDEHEGAEDDGSINRDELPLVLRRDRVKDERPEVHQLFVQRETHDRAVDAERTLEDRLGVDLSRTDAREAIYLAGMAHLDDAEEILRTWGYDL